MIITIGIVRSESKIRYINTWHVALESSSAAGSSRGVGCEISSSYIPIRGVTREILVMASGAPAVFGKFSGSEVYTVGIIFEIVSSAEPSRSIGSEFFVVVDGKFCIGTRGFVKVWVGFGETEQFGRGAEGGNVAGE